MQMHINRYYHRYVDSFINFLVPQNKKILKIDYVNRTTYENNVNNQELFDYVVIKDALAHIYDVQIFLQKISSKIHDDGRIVITQYNSLWEPILKAASALKLRMPIKEENWLSILDIKNFAYLSNLEVVKSGTKMMLPVYIPLLSVFFNKILSNIFPFSKLGIFHYLILRKAKNIHISDKPSVSIIVPARNEAGTIDKIIKGLPSLGTFTELIFVEGHSTDNTLNTIERLTTSYSGNKKIKYTTQDGKGKGDAVRKGFEMAQGDILMIYDADMTVPAEEVHKFYNAIVSNAGDFINGSRLVYPMEKQSMRFLNILGNKFFAFAFSAILGQTIKDTLCGTKVLWKKDYQNIKENRKFFGDFDPFGDFDLIFGAAKLNLKMIDMPIHYKERSYGSTNISRWKHGWLLLKMTIFAMRKIKFLI